MRADDIITFWFEELTEKQWWVKDDDLDQQIKERFEPYVLAAKRAEFYAWRETALGRLAEIIVLDQFPRNIYRNRPEAFSGDAMAVILAQEAYTLRAHEQIERGKSFLYMPLMHSESKPVHELALEVFSNKEISGSPDFELKHKAIIDRFGRYPHRNEILGRKSTPEELEFLKGPNSSF